MNAGAQKAPWTLPVTGETDEDEGCESVIEDDDTDCMRRLAAGDDEAMVEIVRRWHGPLMGFFYRSVGSREDAEDMAQTVMLKLYRAAPRYRPQAKFSSFLFVIARRVMLNHQRFFFRKRSRLVGEASVPEGWMADGGSDAKISEIEEFFQKTLESLPENQRTAILLCKQQGLTYAEIAEAMRTNEGRVKSWIFRARKKLKEAYDEENRS